RNNGRNFHRNHVFKAGRGVIRAKKSLGQNFLVDPRVARRIVEAVSPLKTDIIIEIGPGTGALTRLLTERSGYVVAVEIDSRLVEELSRSMTASNLSVREADALKVDWDSLVDEAVSGWKKISGSASDPRVRVVANLPYYISTPIIERLMGLGARLFDLTLMLQKEVVDRITSQPANREYGYLSVIVQYHAKARKLFEVPPSAFRPAPKVRSAIIRLEMKDHRELSEEEEKKFFALVSLAFSQRRKTILNNLKAAKSLFSADIEAALQRSNIDPRRRAETLSLAEFLRLHRELNSMPPSV
ncbi:MAG: 16S rRNA (adenine(1518)-N(6)/adenine(1519)-N(6))-dimethyltransferase RsmA, partial [Acidobacteriota bacterium]